MCVNKAFIRKKYIRSIDVLETTRRTNEKERDKFSSGLRYGFKQRSNSPCNEMQKDNSSVGPRYSNIEEKSGIFRVFHSQFPLPYKNRIDVFLCFSVFLSLSSFVHLHDMCVRTGKQVGYFHFRYRWLYITIDIGEKSGKRDELNGWVSASEPKNEWKRDCGGFKEEEREKIIIHRTIRRKWREVFWKETFNKETVNEKMELWSYDECDEECRINVQINLWNINNI